MFWRNSHPSEREGNGKNTTTEKKCLKTCSLAREQKHTLKIKLTLVKELRCQEMRYIIFQFFPKYPLSCELLKIKRQIFKKNKSYCHLVISFLELHESQLQLSKTRFYSCHSQHIY